MSNTTSSAGHRAASTTPERLGMIWAEAADRIIGKNGAMPWSLPEDLAHFKRTTLGHPVVMGRKTWESFPEKFRPLPERTNIVITRDVASHAALSAGGATPVASPEEALKVARASKGAEEIWVIGGGEIYAAFAKQANLVVMTVINATPEGDTRSPELSSGWNKSMSEPDNGWLTSANGTKYRIEAWERVA